MEMIQDNHQWDPLAEKFLQDLGFLARDNQGEENRGQPEDTIEEAE